MNRRLSCPVCGSSENLATVETIFGLALIDSELDENGEFSYLGDTVIDWNCQETVTDTLGRPKLHCRGCFQEWFLDPETTDAQAT